MEYLAIVIALGLGYFIGLMQNGINIKHKDFEMEKDEEGNPIYNESIHSLSEEQRKWIEENRRV